jgi:Glycosyltransferase 61
MSDVKSFTEKVVGRLHTIGQQLLNKNFQRIHLGSSSIYAKAYSISTPFSAISFDGVDATIAEAFQWHSAQAQPTYFFDFERRALIDPLTGWLLSSNRLIVESVPYAVEFRVGNPSFSAYRFRKKRRVSFTEAATIRFNWGNYWHFFNDALGQLCMMDDFHVPFATPIVVPEYVQRIPFVEEAFRRTAWLSGRRWIFPNADTWVEADRWYFCKSSPPQINYLRRILDHLQVSNPENEAEKLIFVSRENSDQRHIENQSEIEAIAQAAGLMVIEPRSLSLDEQISRFSGARLVVGPHGAGLTNILFRGHGPLLLFELFPQDYIKPYYFWLSRLLGQRYSAMTGSRLVDGRFWVDPKLFQSRLAELLAQLQ